MTDTDIKELREENKKLYVLITLLMVEKTRLCERLQMIGRKSDIMLSGITPYSLNINELIEALGINKQDEENNASD